MAMAYNNVYVASVALGANDQQTLRAFAEAEAYEGTSIIIAYSHCIAHGIDMSSPLSHQKAVVDAGQWLLYRFNPTLADEGKNPLQIDSKAPKTKVAEFLNSENRFKMLAKSHPDMAKMYADYAQEQVDNRIKLYNHLAARSFAE